MVTKIWTDTEKEIARQRSKKYWADRKLMMSNGSVNSIDSNGVNGSLNNINNGDVENTKVNSIDTVRQFQRKIIPKMQKICIKVLDRLNNNQPDGKQYPQDATVFAILFDKLQLATGKATQNISVVRYNFKLKESPTNG